MDNNVGIYLISCLENDKVYVGSSGGVKGRLDYHKRQLRRNKHYNIKLQSAFNKYGEYFFSFEHYEHCSIEKLEKREDYWINAFDAIESGFNVAIDTSCPTRGINKPDSWRDKMEKEYHLIDPLGNEVKFKGMHKFCRDNHLSQQGLIPVTSGRLFQCKGWRLYKPELVGIPYNKKEANRNALLKQWKTRIPKQVLLPYSIEEIKNFYLEDKLSLAEIAKKCGMNYHRYIYDILNKENVQMRPSGGSTHKGKNKIKL